ncbi:MAG TPA: BTAD domain-containing putative transcriptional regulator [Actinophytocola sp.]|uniref:AfsR/SARP family transcriptional regulator n=1 Tax=Actinophytocola sp. TaxID=1872138 RepID=UPI002DB5CEC3|nr:BTAD domain-containing putative transcriptional regulator [Actinophytocola sp.]HEU5471110.1 BTAD domain-containing putative transcriptional regulator [Actinophytocola sp.]
MPPVDVLVLGPVALRVDGRLVSPSARSIRTLLGVLAVAGRRGISDAALAGRLWPEPGSEAGLRVLVHRARAWLRDAAGPAVTVARTPSGYVLRFESGRCDLDRFNEIVAGADPPRGADRATTLDSALALWRGPALDDVPDAEADRTELERARLRVVVDCAECWLSAGRPERAVSLLGPMVARHPLDEPAHGAWIEALATAGRQADALAAFESLRVRLREELGVDPSRQVSRALLRVLRQELPVAEAGEHRMVPAQLPAAAGTFVGRDAELRRLDELLGGTAPGVIVGTGGVGKTALAVRWAHGVADRFPDGQLYADLRGYSGGPPVRPLDALTGFLRALGIPPDGLPTAVDEAAALFRSTVAGRRLIVVLDNALDAAQVRPLLPGSPGCLALVTSRDRMAGLIALNGAGCVSLDVLGSPDAHRLLRETLGAPRIVTDPDAVAEIVAACAGLPLALRIVAAHLLARPALSLARYAAQLTAPGRLDQLAVHGDTAAAVAATFAHSYRRLPPAARRMFRLVGLVPGADLTPAAAAVLAGCPVAEAHRLLFRLAAGHLLTEPGPDRFGCHDLLRAYAAGLAAREDDAAGRAAALVRLSDWYLGTAHAAARMVFPLTLRLSTPPSTVDPMVFADPAAATEWLDQERGNLVATALHELGPVTWRLADALRMYLFRWRHNADALRLAEAAARCAERSGSLDGRAAAELALATARACIGEISEALAHCANAVALSRCAGWTEGEVGALANQAILHTELGDLDAATRCLEECRIVNQRLGNLARTAATLNNLGTVHLHAGRLTDAVAAHREALRIYRSLGDPSYEQVTLHNLGVALRELGELDEAAELLERKLAMIEANGEHHGKAGALADLARIACERSRFDEAHRLAEVALRAAELAGDRIDETAARLGLAEACRGLGRLTDAAEHGVRALELARALRNARLEAEALLGAALTDQALGRAGDAFRHARQALARCHECGLLLVEARVLDALAELHRAGGRPQRAAELARLAGRAAPARRPARCRWADVTGL